MSETAATLLGHCVVFGDDYFLRFFLRFFVGWCGPSVSDLPSTGGPQLLQRWLDVFPVVETISLTSQELELAEQQQFALFVSGSRSYVSESLVKCEFGIRALCDR
jgi:hypothetical protein